MENNGKEREKFQSRLGFILVSAGCAIGLGNVWKFPYICGMYGGAAFILIYLCCLGLLGLPILICEFAMGRGSRQSLGKAMSSLSQTDGRWQKFRWFAFAGNYLLMMFYTMVAGWIVYYAYMTITGKLQGKAPTQVEGIFGEMLTNPGNMIFWTLLVIVACIGVCALGLKNGVEKITKTMMLILISLMLVMAVRAVTLENSAVGLKFYLVPDFKRMVDQGIGNVVFAAMTHAFFTLSVGIGSMEIFGSYLEKDRKLTGEAASVVLLDTAVALVAGIIIIPSCFAYNIAPDSGPSLLFITLPNVFNHMPFGEIWGAFFFVFMSFAALSTVIAVFENIISIACDLFDWDRKRSLFVNLFGIAILAMPAVLGFNLLSGIQPLGAGSGIMDLEDFLVSYNILPLGSLLMVLFCTRKNGWGFEHFVSEVNIGKGKDFPTAIKGYISYVVPALVLVIYFKGYYDMFAGRDLVTFLIWMGIAVLFAGFTIWLALPKKSAKIKKVQS